jgi:hypothetical protein
MGAGLVAEGATCPARYSASVLGAIIRPSKMLARFEELRALL